jgi:flagellar protein FlbD
VVGVVIILEHLSGKEFMLNADLIERIDENPDTMIVLTNGRHYVVRTSRDEVVSRVIEYKRRLAAGPVPAGEG